MNSSEDLSAGIGGGASSFALVPFFVPHARPGLLSSQCPHLPGAHPRARMLEPLRPPPRCSACSARHMRSGDAGPAPSVSSSAASRFRSHFLQLFPCGSGWTDF